MPEFRHHRAAILAASVLIFLGCAEHAPEPATQAPETLLSEGPHEVAVLAIEDLGEIRLELLPEIAPQTVANFKSLIETGFYDSTSFHRVIPGFMIQGGDPNSKDRDPRNDGSGGLGHTIPDEFSPLPHTRGTVAMANKGRGTASSQFFIVQQDSPHLDGHYTIFGRVVEGMDVVDAITELEIDQFGRWGPRDRPYPVQAVVGASRIEGGVAGADVTASRGAAEAS